jgi:hypothetical protein
VVDVALLTVHEHGSGSCFTQGSADTVDRGETTDGVPSRKLLKTLRSGLGDYIHLTGVACMPDASPQIVVLQNSNAYDVAVAIVCRTVA